MELEYFSLHCWEIPVALQTKLKKDEVVYCLRGDHTCNTISFPIDVTIVSTKHSPTTSIRNKVDCLGMSVMKPIVILDYNNQIGVDHSDEILKYNTFMRKTVK